MTKLEKKRDELCVETESADEQKGFVIGWDQCLAELMPQVKKLAQAIENYCNANCVWNVDRKSMFYQGSNEQQFLDALAEWKKYVGEK